MRLKSFYGRTLNEAMAEVRTVLGGDAIIVATRDDEAGGIRVTAAIDEAVARAAAPAVPVVKPLLARVESAHSSDMLDQLSDLLTGHGVPEPLRERILGTVGNFATDDPLLGLSAAFDTMLGFAPLVEDGVRRPIALIGPPGAGKTVMIAKLAARMRLAGKSVGLISADTLKAGGVEQLQAFAHILKAPLVTIEDGASLRDAIEVQKKHDLILIDMAGSNILVSAEMDDLKNMLQAGECEPALVLPAGIDLQEGIEMARCFQDLGVRRLLLSRLDATRRLGVLLAIACESELLLTDASHSPKVAEGLVALNPVTLARFFLADKKAMARAGSAAPPKPAVVFNTESDVRKSKVV